MNNKPTNHNRGYTFDRPTEVSFYGRSNRPGAPLEIRSFKAKSSQLANPNYRVNYESLLARHTDAINLKKPFKFFRLKDIKGKRIPVKSAPRTHAFQKASRKLLSRTTRNRQLTELVNDLPPDAFQNIDEAFENLGENEDNEERNREIEELNRLSGNIIGRGLNPLQKLIKARGETARVAHKTKQMIETEHNKLLAPDRRLTEKLAPLLIYNLSKEGKAARARKERKYILQKKRAKKAEAATVEEVFSDWLPNPKHQNRKNGMPIPKWIRHKK